MAFSGCAVLWDDQYPNLYNYDIFVEYGVISFLCEQTSDLCYQFPVKYHGKLCETMSCDPIPT